LPFTLAGPAEELCETGCTTFIPGAATLFYRWVACVRMSTGQSANRPTGQSARQWEGAVPRLASHDILLRSLASIRPNRLTLRANRPTGQSANWPTDIRWSSLLTPARPSAPKWVALRANTHVKPPIANRPTGSVA
jgi:hypothetical protein